MLGVELALLEPWLANLLAYRVAGYQTPGAAMELFAISLVFAVVLAAMLYTIARVAYGFSLPAAWRAAPAQLAEALRGGESLRVPATAQDRIPANVDRPRAVTVADAVAATQRRESPMPAAAMAAAGGAPSRTVIPRRPRPRSAAVGADPARPKLPSPHPDPSFGQRQPQG